VHPYLRRRNKTEEPEYPNEAIKKVLEKTLGVPLFQEQCMQLAIVAAGFTPGEADQLRRAMGAWRRPGLIDQFRKKLIDGMSSHGLTGEFAERVFQQIRGFGEYGFPESHAASFALLVYVSAWLKCHYPAEFTAAVINSQPMGFYAPAQLIRDARGHGVTVRPINVNASCWDCTIEDGSCLRLGFRLIKGFQNIWAETLVRARNQKPFSSMKDFLLRTRLPLNQVTTLAEADAFCGVKDSRRKSLWKALAADAQPKQLLLFEQIGLEESESVLPEMTPEEEVYADYQATGLSLRSHPLAFQRERLEELGVIPNAELARTPNGTPIKIAGIVLLRQRPSTAKGITFVTIEDETGTANLVLFQDVWEHYRKITRHSGAWIVHGEVESKEAVIHVIVKRVEDLSQCLSHLKMKPRNFR
ncbi:MAG: error-prone DNA polymerase, partial [Planctomycetaceae bacterium]|nr:error-prone DNA polymerase [Planctomycetaceae bacterium]